MKIFISFLLLLALAQAEAPKLMITDQGLMLSVQATGTAPLTYQWYISGKPIDTDTGHKPVLELAPPYKSGLYYCEVTNAAGKAVSDPVRIANTAQADAAPLTITFKAPN